MSELIRINRNDITLIRKASITGANAFADDPDTIHLIPDVKKRANLHFAFEYFLRSSLAAGSEVYATSNDCEGIAVWSFSGIKISPFFMLTGNPLLPLRCGWRYILGSMSENRFAEKMKRLYAPNPHEYLALLAVTPAYQNNGMGSKLLAPMLKRLDEQRLPCYLETQNMKNVNMYRHFGFDLVYETQLPKSNLPSFIMVRRQHTSTQQIHEKIWDLALPYQDKRNDAGHAEVTLHFARILLDIEKGNEDVIVPAIMLHDIGWSQVTDRMTVFDRNAAKEDRKRVVMQHQQHSVELARGILNQVGYDPGLIEEILEIISQHDTRKGFISKNDGLVRDADKLWRVSKRGVNAAESRDIKDDDKNKFKKQFWRMAAANDRKDYLYSEAAKRIARQQIEDRKRETKS